MAIVECNECEGKVSTTAKSCPHCGAKEYRNSFSIRMLEKLTMSVAEHGGKYLPLPIVESIVWLIFVLYILFFLNIPLIVGYGLLLLEPSVDFPDIVATWSNWVVDIYFEFYSNTYEFLKSKF
ncbi:hypothetical protein ACUN9Y_18475 [Halomonas sp. V046]|uniref:hypothetical protein n=1 Tax=Halomonas sp. V046 TaxID=3459611 RepID=UPI004044FC50